MLTVFSVFLVWLLARSATAMDAARAACRLFAGSVMPGLFPYMVGVLLVTSRLPPGAPPWLLTVMGWCGGSPAGARALALRPDLDRAQKKRVAVACATMSPMFLVGTVAQWTGSPGCGLCLLAASTLGGWLTGRLAGRSARRDAPAAPDTPPSPLAFPDAVMQAARTMLLVCGTMMLLRVAAALVGELLAGLPWAQLLLMTLLEVTSGAADLAILPLPLALRTAFLAAAVSFGGAAILLQNRTAYPEGLLSLGEQVLWQAAHALLSGVIALGLALFAGI